MESKSWTKELNVGFSFSYKSLPTISSTLGSETKRWVISLGGGEATSLSDHTGAYFEIGHTQRKSYFC